MINFNRQVNLKKEPWICMCKNFLLVVLACFLLAMNAHVIKSMDKKTDYLNAWMIWKTSKEYDIREKPINSLKTLDIKKNIAKYDSGDDMMINNKRYMVLNSNFLPMFPAIREPAPSEHILDGPFSINALYGLTIGYMIKNDQRSYYMYDYWTSDISKIPCSSVKNAIFGLSVMAIPELGDRYCDKNSDHNSSSFFSFFFKKDKRYDLDSSDFLFTTDDMMIIKILDKNTILIIAPKRIPSKNLLSFNNLYDVTFKFKNHLYKAM